MNKYFIKLSCLTIIFAIILSGCIYQPQAHARISFNRFNRVTRRVFRKVKRGTKFVVNLPDKATRWMGPVLGPIASTVLTGNIAKNPSWSKILSRARKVNKAIDTVEGVEEKQKYLRDLRTAYRDQAVELRKQANDIRESRRQMLSKLSSGDITYADYRKHVIDLNDTAAIYEKTADKFETSANNMNPEDIAGIFSRNLLNTVWGEVKNAVVYETSKELSKFVDPRIIKRLVDNEGVNLDTLIDALASEQIDNYLGQGEEIDADALRDRVRDRIKDILKENKEGLKANWKEEIDEIVRKTKDELVKEKNKLPPADTKKEQKKEVKKEDFFEPNPDSADKCGNGYTWDIKIGKCIQENCNSDNILNAHYSYVKDCVCGSSGSMYEDPDDPNKGCRYPTSYKACPGCIYACVGAEDECPDF